MASNTMENHTSHKRTIENVRENIITRYTKHSSTASLNSNSLKTKEYRKTSAAVARSKTFVLPRRESVSCETSINLKWVPLAPLGPTAAFHTCAVIGDTLYVHGGVKDILTFNVPSSQFYKLDLTTLLWQEVETPGSPALSHHASVVLEDRYLTLIGGWNGKKRLADIFVYDTVEDCWLTVQQVGFPIGAGLSSHTASVTSDGNILVVGREGCLRTQRKHGNMYRLSGSVACGKFFYTPLSDNVISRSGHTTNLINNNLYILGGRSDQLLEKVVGIQNKRSLSCTVLDKIGSAINASGQKHLAKLPCGRKHHVAAASENSILVHGGETFDGKARQPVGEMFFISLKPLTKFFWLKSTEFCRSGHACLILPNRVLVHGGRSGKNQIHSDLYELVVE